MFTETFCVCSRDSALKKQAPFYSWCVCVPFVDTNTHKRSLCVLQLDKVQFSFDGGITTMNFSQAAFVIQKSACVYSKKVGRCDLKVSAMAMLSVCVSIKIRLSCMVRNNSIFKRAIPIVQSHAFCCHRSSVFSVSLCGHTEGVPPSPGFFSKGTAVFLVTFHLILKNGTFVDIFTKSLFFKRNNIMLTNQGIVLCPGKKKRAAFAAAPLPVKVVRNPFGGQVLTNFAPRSLIFDLLHFRTCKVRIQTFNDSTAMHLFYWKICYGCVLVAG